MVKKIVAAMAVAAVAFSVSAQNARIDAMGGCNIVPDISRVLINPADINSFTDQIQVTGTPTAFGPAFGFKSVGKFSFGAMANQVTGAGSSVLRSSFCQDASTFINTIIAPGTIPASFPIYPHLLFGFDLDAVEIGLDIFFEMTRYSRIEENAPTSVEYKGSMYNIGSALSANINLGSLTLTPFFRIAAPRISGLNELPDPDIDAESEAGVAIYPGAECRLDMNNLTFVAGGYYSFEKYQFKRDTISLDENMESFLDAYAGMTADILNGLLFVTQYNFSLGLDKTIRVSDDSTYTYTDLFHTFRFGVEKPVDGVWIFDEIVPRAGILYSMYELNRFHGEDNDGDTTTNINNPNGSTQVLLTCGLGLKKGIASIDVQANIGSWNGVLTGPSVVKGTLTLEFGKTSSSTTRSNETSAPSPVYSTEESDTTTTTNDSNKSYLDY